MYIFHKQMDIRGSKIHHQDIALEMKLFLVEIKHIFLHHFDKLVVLALDMDNKNLSHECPFYTTKYAYYQILVDYYRSIDTNPLENEITIYNISVFFSVCIA